MSIQNTHTGSGPQNNNHAGTQHIHYDGQIGQVSGGEVSFVKYFNTTVSNPHKNLWDAIAGVGASHKAEHQFSRGECLEGTRKRALVAIHDWASAKGPEALPICWLSGPAGVGKTAIALTIAQSFEGLSLLASSFFFFRSDPKRNNPSALVLTIAHELATTSSFMRNCIERRISTDPKIMEARLEEQFRELIIAPALAWSLSGGAPVVPNIVIIDGLDECGDDETQLRVLSIIGSAYQQGPRLPLRFLICSRPEAWIREGFSDEPLSRLSRNIILDDSLEAREDIRRYYLHHFREIANSQKYRQVRFPNPWPSERDLEILIERSCAQFVYASTVIKFIKFAYSHPIAQLRIILASTSERQPSKSPYHDLDCLYHVILSANPNYDQLVPILVAILIFPKDARVMPTPALVEMVLGLAAGQVDLALRGMHSVLKIGDWNDPILPYHASLSDYLVDRTRSCDFYIDMPVQRHVIAHRWLENLSVSRVRSLRYGHVYRLSQFADASRSQSIHSLDQLSLVIYFVTGWIDLCMSISQPTRDLLDDLWHVDLAFVYTQRWGRGRRWSSEFEGLLRWVKRYPHQAVIDYDSSRSQNVRHAQFPDSHHPFHANTVGSVADIFHRAAHEWNVADLVVALTHKLQNVPGCFHLKWFPAGAEPPHNKVICEVVQFATDCPYSLNFGADNIVGIRRQVSLSECQCDLWGEDESHDPQHVAYQDACMQYAKILRSKFTEMIALNDERGAYSDIDSDLEEIFRNLVESEVLKHCRLGMELFSLCQTFLELAKDHLMFLLNGDVGRGRRNLLNWIKTFPEKFTEEGKVLKAQVLALPSSEQEEYEGDEERSEENDGRGK
ncbi:hypothetical protein PM082_020951 [Marasmius tenuissimus]|nr:hypothetical protein PM082_020951 [Marasmius tenuissimus]